MHFYTTLGFNVIDGGHMNKNFPDTEEGRWRILENESLKIGLFEGMFDKNILTFYPEDVRGIQKKLKEQGITLDQEIEENTVGPGSIVLKDPDGNVLMFEEY